MSEALSGFWLKLRKGRRSKLTVTKAKAIEVAICCGWIDGQLAKFDDASFLMRMTPRRPRSRWSKMNCATAERLATLGRLKAAGIAEITAAKSDGRWNAAYAPQSKSEVPDDLIAALEANAVRRFFASLDCANRFSIIYGINAPKRPETRARHIKEFVEMLSRGENHPSGKGYRRT